MSATKTNAPTQNASTAAMQGGLSNPVYQTQATFRTMMDAMARPGKVIAHKTDANPPEGISPLAGAILATLADADTPVWLDDSLQEKSLVKEWLTFHVGAPFADEPAKAAFAVIPQGNRMPHLEIFNLGEPEYPDRSTTLIIEVETFNADCSWKLEGPGIKDSKAFGVEPISQLFASQWASNRELFPRGVDIIFVSSDAIACLPRTTRISLVDPKGDAKGGEL